MNRNDYFANLDFNATNKAILLNNLSNEAIVLIEHLLSGLPLQPLLPLSVSVYITMYKTARRIIIASGHFVVIISKGLNRDSIFERRSIILPLIWNKGN